MRVFSYLRFLLLGNTFLISGGLLLSGCAQELPATADLASGTTVSSPITTPAGAPSISSGGAEPDSSTPSPTASSGDEGKLSKCTRELSALKKFNNAKYAKYQREFDQITRTSSAYLGVAGGISSDINDLVRPKYQYALTNLCWRIKNDLSAALINQVATHD